MAQPHVAHSRNEGRLHSLAQRNALLRKGERARAVAHERLDEREQEHRFTVGARWADGTVRRGAGGAPFARGQPFQRDARLRQAAGAQLDACIKRIVARRLVAQRFGFAPQRFGLGRLAHVELVLGHEHEQAGTRLSVGRAISQAQRLLQQRFGLCRAHGVEIDKRLPAQRAADARGVVSRPPTRLGQGIPCQRTVEKAAHAVGVAQQRVETRMLRKNIGRERVYPVGQANQAPRLQHRIADGLDRRRGGLVFLRRQPVANCHIGRAPRLVPSCGAQMACACRGRVGCPLDAQEVMEEMVVAPRVVAQSHHKEIEGIQFVQVCGAGCGVVLAAHSRARARR